MYDHIGLRVGDIDTAVRFYTAALAPLGFVLCSRDDSGAGFGPKDAPALWLHLNKGKAATGAHVAFRAKTHDAVKKFHAGDPLYRQALELACAAINDLDQRPASHHRGEDRREYADHQHDREAANRARTK